VLPAKYGPAGEMDFVIAVIAGSATETVTFVEDEPIVEPSMRRETLLIRKLVTFAPV